MYRTIVLRIAHIWLVVHLVWLARLGGSVVESAGWITCPPAVVVWRRRCSSRRAQGRRSKGRRCACTADSGPCAGGGGSGEDEGGWHRGWRIALLRSVFLWGLWQCSGQRGPGWVALLPWAIWVLQGLGARRIAGVLWQVQRVAMVAYLLADAVLMVRGELLRSPLWFIGLGCGVRPENGARVDVDRQEDGSYQVHLSGRFELHVSGDHWFRARLVMVFLGLLQSEADGRGSRRTRDGRTPFVRQEQLAAWFGVPQEQVSRHMRYWLEGSWAKLLSLHSEVLTAELRQRIVDVCAMFPPWSNERVHHYLRQQGVRVTAAQVDQAAEESGWKQLRLSLSERYSWDESSAPAGTWSPRESWLIQELWGLAQKLLGRWEEGQAPLPEERIQVHDLKTLVETLGIGPTPAEKGSPWLLRLEQVLFKPSLRALEEAGGAESVRCPHCGSNDVGSKSKTPRQRSYYDEQGKLQQVDVYRYYCRNPQCAHKSFTHLPAGLAPHSRYRAELHVLALQMYVWGYSTYRRTGAALGACGMTAWRWVSAWGHDLLPVAALFGLLRCSGVVGVDEKYVLVPKNDKPDEPMRRWMYVYLAVDVWTYDLLHIAIYPHNTEAAAKTFLLALRAKGYHPDVLVTDLRADYGPAIAAVFPQAVHHECIFHAMQNVHRQLKEVYGRHYQQHHPQVAALKQRIYAVFQAPTQAEAQQRYAQLLAERPSVVQDMPAAGGLFDFLERHWPKLVNGIADARIPATNNAVELVIRRFNQHYRGFCGFESLHTAQCYLAVFEKVYRFTPFSADAQERIRGKSPLQLAGYDVASLPMTSLCAGRSLSWPLTLVPNT